MPEEVLVEDRAQVPPETLPQHRKTKRRSADDVTPRDLWRHADEIRFRKVRLHSRRMLKVVQRSQLSGTHRIYSLFFRIYVPVDLKHFLI